MVEPVKKQPSLKKILWTDYPAFIYTSFAIASWIVYLAWVPSWRKSGPIISAELSPYALLIAIFISLLALGVVAYRLRLIKTIFKNGVEVRGKITEITLPRDRGKVHYSFYYNNKEFNSYAPIHRNKQTLDLKNGDRVILIIDPEQPVRAFIRDLYLKAEG
jgi:hypothetical protein